MLRLRLAVDHEHAEDVVTALGRERGVGGITRFQRATADGEDHVEAWVHEAAVDDVLAVLRELGVVRRGGVTLGRERVIAPGPMPWSIPQLDPGADVIVWEEVEGHAGSTSRTSARYLVLMAIAGMIAAVGVLENSPVPIVGAMAVSPDLLPLVSIAYGVATRRPGISLRAVGTLAVGLLAAIAFAAVAAGVAHLAGLVDAGVTGRGFLVGFVTTPSVLGGLVAFAAGIAGMLSFQSLEGGSAIGVAISITTIPAAAAVGVHAVEGAWVDLLGALSVLGVNLTSVAIGGAATVLVQRRARSRGGGT